MQSQLERKVGGPAVMTESKRERIRAAILSDEEGWEGARRALAKIEAGGPVYRWDGERFERVEGTPVAPRP